MARPQPQRRDSKPPDGQDYEFYPLTGTNPIRLLYLEPDTANQTLRYTLKAADLSSKSLLVYNCLSYTWAYPQWDKISAVPIDTTHAGDRKKRIDCDGKSIYITENLEFALTRLREDMASIDEDRQERTPMWIDAICIHQESDEERSVQVAKMDEIYRHAQKVIVWLGPEDKDYTSTAVDVLSRLSAVPKEIWNADIPGGLKHPEIYTRLGVGPIYESEWQALGELLMRTWFSRIWVIQETFEAREVIVYCGKHVLSWKQIVEVSELLMVTGLGQAIMEFLDKLTSPLDEEGEEDGNDNDDEETVGSVDDDVGGDVYVGNTLNNQWLFESLREQKEDLKLETLLTYARYFGATGHSDYVYAMRGMWKPAHEDHQRLRESIKPNYKTPVEDVFTAAAYASLIEMGDLNILSLVEDHSLRAARAREEHVANKKERDPKKEKVRSKDLPSWVPDWSIPPIAETLCLNPRPKMGSERWTASKGLPYTSPAEPIERRLRVKGMFITTIAEKAAREPEFLDGIDGIDDMEVFALLELLSNLLDHPSSTVSDLIDSFWRTIIKDTYRDAEAGDEARQAFTSFLTVRIFEIENSLVDPSSPPLETLDSQTPPANDSPHTKLEALLNNISARDATGTIPTYQTVRQIIEKEKENMEFTGINEEDKFFAESFRSAYLGRRLFYTAEDETKGVMLGIGPDSLKKEDEVWAVAGADVPMVLRPRGEGKWRLVGECYVHGIMRGEAVRNGSGGQNIQDKKGMKQVMDIVLV
ncbi:hypothetical protein G7Y89_g15091 [Cudoniella acicularis]|uniref:Heterokaryon incompatibility domain-containing protein n=1 Tax=Cudoniella acicularis TaxID=354080 RepID=A0A8H4QTF5_9HELO|nr:hypothetical protein G7Y89_g15091 [Cudoniella acicularis]